MISLEYRNQVAIMRLNRAVTNALYLEILKTGRVLHGKAFAEVLKDDAEKNIRPKRSQG